MKAFKYIILIIHIIAVLSVMAYTLTFDHAALGKGFTKCEQYMNDVYLLEDAGSYSVLYKGDHTGDISNVYSSNQGQIGVTIVDFCVADDIYILESAKNGYSIKRLYEDNIAATSKTKPFTLSDVERISDFYVNLSDNMAYITAIRNDGIGAYVYTFKLSGLAPLGSDETELKSGEKPMELPVTFRYDAVSSVVSAAYYDGSDIITEVRPPSEYAIDTNNYSGTMKLSLGQSLKVNINVFIIYIAYAIAGLLLIVLIARFIERRRRFTDIIFINEIFILMAMVFGAFMIGNIPMVLIWALVFSIVNILIVWFENRDIRVLSEDMKRISTGNLDLEKPPGSSIETGVLWRGMNEVKYLYEEYKYINETSTAAALRFLPHSIGAMFNNSSLDEIKPGDSVSVFGTFMTLRTKKEISNSLISMTEDYEKSAGGTLLTGECSNSEIRMLFSKPESDPVDLGLNFFAKMGDDSACSLYFMDNFKISVVGTPTKSILNISSVQIDTMERLAEWFFDMGIHMVISKDVKENQGGTNTPLRYIGYSYIDGKKKDFYEVLNAYGEKTRSDRLRCLEEFDNALSLLYESNYYLARTAFTEILKLDPSDELARWYLFICEKYLNNPELSDRFCALDPRN